MVNKDLLRPEIINVWRHDGKTSKKKIDNFENSNFEVQ